MISRLLPKILGITIILGSFTAGWFFIDIQAFMRAPLLSTEHPVLYTVEPGSNIKGIANDFVKAGLLEHPQYLVFLARWKNVAAHIKAGEYEVPPGIRPEEFLDQLVAGKVIQYSLTMLEGWSFQQMMEAVQRHPKLDHLLTGLSDDVIMDRLGHPGQHPEGRFFPDTYLFTRDTMDVALLQHAYAAMEEYLETAWQRRAPDLPFESPYQALILASIIEKETAVAEEREQIAGVFVRRLKKKMRLQTDPTVIYGLGNEFDGNLRRRDLTSENPYNTYLNKGLPPTPIAMPGGASINAALHPAAGDTLYFVARGDGTHEFSATIEQHNMAVRKYQLKRR